MKTNIVYILDGSIYHFTLIKFVFRKRAETRTMASRSSRARTFTNNFGKSRHPRSITRTNYEHESRYCATLPDVEEYINSASIYAIDFTERKQVKKALARLRGHVLAAIPENNQPLLIPQAGDMTVEAILKAVRRNLLAVSPTEHALLRQEAELRQCEYPTQIYQFLEKHEAIIARMLAAQHLLTKTRASQLIWPSEDSYLTSSLTQLEEFG